MDKPEPTSQQVTQTLKLLDQNRDGKISFKEIESVLG
jgi:Ca2+-binding EF-hand superfamily protein